MRYSEDFIEEVVECYSRVNNKSYVSEKYNINLLTIGKWVQQAELNENRRKYAKKLAQLYEIVSYHSQVKDDSKVAERFNLNPKNIAKTIENYKLELWFKTPNFRNVKKELLKLNSLFSKAYSSTASCFVLEKLILTELCLGEKSSNIIEKYSVTGEYIVNIKKKYNCIVLN